MAFKNSISMLAAIGARLVLAAPILAATSLPVQANEPSAAPQRGAQSAPAARLDTPSGLPVPRFVSLKTNKTFCRAGPSFAHPVRITYMRKGLPMLVIAESADHWRKLRDPDGDQCWAHKSTLSGADTALVVRDGLILRTRPNAKAPARARLGQGVIAKVEKEKDGWLKISTDPVNGGLKGWARLSGFWGASMRQDAPPN